MRTLTSTIGEPSARSSTRPRIPPRSAVWPSAIAGACRNTSSNPASRACRISNPVCENVFRRVGVIRSIAVRALEPDPAQDGEDAVVHAAGDQCPLVQIREPEGVAAVGREVADGDAGAERDAEVEGLDF